MNEYLIAPNEFPSHNTERRQIKEYCWELGGKGDVATARPLSLRFVRHTTFHSIPFLSFLAKAAISLHRRSPRLLSHYTRRHPYPGPTASPNALNQSYQHRHNIASSRYRFQSTPLHTFCLFLYSPRSTFIFQPRLPRPLQSLEKKIWNDGDDDNNAACRSSHSCLVYCCIV